MTLYEMAAAASELLALLEEDVIDEQTFNDTLEGLGATEKVEGCCQVLAELTADVGKVKTEIDRLTAKKKSLESNIKWLKGQMLNFYYANGSKKIDAGTFTVSARKSEAVEVTDIDLLPKQFVKVVETHTADKTAIKEAIKNGAEVKGAALVVKDNLQVK